MLTSLRRWTPNRIDRYVLGEVVGPFFGGVVFFVFVFLMFQALRLAEFFIVHGVPLTTLGRMTMLLSLSFLPMVIPVAFLIAVLVSFGRMSSDSEVVAMKASGIGLLRIAVPAVALAIPVVMISLALNLDWVPWSARSFKSLLIKVGNTKVVSSIKEGAFTSGFFDLLIFADKVDNDTNRMEHVFIYDEREAKNAMTIVAQSGQFIPVKTQNELGSAAMLKLYDGSIHHNDIVGNTYQKIDFKEYKLFLKVNEAEDELALRPQNYSYSDLNRLIEKHPADTFFGREFRGEFWRRYALAFAPLVFVFLGVGFGTVRTRAVRAGAALIAMITLLVYWGVQTFSIIQVQKGTIPPFLALWLPNFVVGIAAVYVFRRANW